MFNIKPRKLSFIFSTRCPLVLVVVFFFINASFFRQHAHSFAFGDETEHLTLGWMITLFHKYLYSDLSTNHQPIPILLSQVIFRFLHYPNLYLLVSRIRQIMIGFSFIGAFLLTLKFKWRGLLVVIFVETAKFYFLGFHLLAESMVVYPIMYIAGTLTDLNFNRFVSPPNHVDAQIFGFCLFFITFCLSPSWPFLFLAFFFFASHLSRLNYLHLLVGFFAPTLILFNQIDFVAWYQESVINPLLYFIPFQSSVASISTKIYLFFYPLLSFFHLQHWLGSAYFSLTLISLISLYQLNYNRPKGKIIIKATLFYLLLISLNLRISSFDQLFYGAFHLLPQFSFFVMFALSLFYYAFQTNFTLKLPEVSPVSISLISFSIFLILLSTRWWTDSIDPLKMHFIQYGNLESLAMAISAIKLPTDTLLVGELDGYLNLASHTPLATRQNAHLPWSFHSPQLSSQFKYLLSTNPPALVYFPASNNPYYQTLIYYLNNSYTRIFRSDGSPTDLYILTRTLPFRTGWDTWNQLQYQLPPSLKG